MAKPDPADKNRKPNKGLPDVIRKIGDDVISSMKKDGFGGQGNAHSGEPTDAESDSTPQFIILDAGHSGSEEKTPLWNKWRDEFAGKKIPISSSDNYLEIVDAEAECMIWLIALDVHLESAASSGTQDAELERLHENAETAFAQLRKILSKV